MKKRTRTETRVEVREVWVITDLQASPVLCDACANLESVMIGPQEAAVVAGVSLRTIFRWVEAAQVHYVERTDSGLLICSNSLPGGLETTAVRALLPSS